MQSILLLEDDEILLQSICATLEDAGFEVDCARDGESAIDMSFDKSYNLYLLDVNVPFVNGFDFLKQLRESGDSTPAFFITALNDIESLSKGFDSGADDYIKKPFDPDELIIRIKSILKKKHSGLSFAGIMYDENSTDIYKDGKIIPLPKLEKEMFLLLLRHLGSTVTKEMIYDLMDKQSDQSLRVHMNQMKKALGVNVTNVRGVGYRLEKA
jgi:DNA-binding response OmpR family regulator